MAIEPTKKIWMSGEFVDWDDARIHVLNPTLHYGWGVFEGIRAYATDQGPAVFRLREHIERLFSSAKIYMMPVPWSVDEIVEATRETVRINGLDSCYIRPLLYLGYGEMGVNPLPSAVEGSIAVWPWGAYLGADAQEKGCRTVVSSWQRLGANVIPPQGKASGQYINSSLAKAAALKAGYDEAILTNANGTVAEGTGENLFIVKGDTLITPPVTEGVLKGITRDTVMTLAREQGLTVTESPIVRSELYLADEAFFTGTAAEIVPISEVDDRPVGTGRPGPVVKGLVEAYHGVTTGRSGDHAEWRDVVNR